MLQLKVALFLISFTNELSNGGSTLDTGELQQSNVSSIWKRQAQQTRIEEDFLSDQEPSLPASTKLATRAMSQPGGITQTNTQQKEKKNGIWKILSFCSFRRNASQNSLSQSRIREICEKCKRCSRCQKLRKSISGYSRLTPNQKPLRSLPPEMRRKKYDDVARYMDEDHRRRAMKVAGDMLAHANARPRRRRRSHLGEEKEGEEGSSSCSDEETRERLLGFVTGGLAYEDAQTLSASPPEVGCSEGCGCVGAVLEWFKQCWNNIDFSSCPSPSECCSCIDGECCFKFLCGLICGCSDP